MNRKSLVIELYKKVCPFSYQYNEKYCKDSIQFLENAPTKENEFMREDYQLAVVPLTADDNGRISCDKLVANVLYTTACDVFTNKGIPQAVAFGALILHQIALGAEFTNPQISRVTDSIKNNHDINVAIQVF
jgi:hypothetical protein